MTIITETPQGLAFSILVQPRSSRNEIVGRHGDTLKIKLTAPPVQGAANNLCIKFLAKCIGVPKSSVEIVSGHTGRNKRVVLHVTPGRSSLRERQRLKKTVESLL